MMPRLPAPDGGRTNTSFSAPLFDGHQIRNGRSFHCLPIVCTGLRAQSKNKPLVRKCLIFIRRCCYVLQRLQRDRNDTGHSDRTKNRRQKHTKITTDENQQAETAVAAMSDVVARITDLHGQLLSYAKRSFELAYEIGGVLIAQKARVKRGEWGAWGSSFRSHTAMPTTSCSCTGCRTSTNSRTSLALRNFIQRWRSLTMAATRAHPN